MADQSSAVVDYINAHPQDVQVVLREIQRRVADVVPQAGEKISYQMPTVTMEGQSLVYYAAWKQHIGMYPIPPAEPALEELIAPYRASKDTVRFPYKKPIPYELIEKMVAMLVRRRLDSENDPQHGE